MTPKYSPFGLAAALAAALTRTVAKTFGLAMDARVIGPVNWADLAAAALLLLGVVMANLLAVALIRRAALRAAATAPPESKQLRRGIFRALAKPVYLLIWICGAYLAAAPLMIKLPPSDGLRAVHGFFHRVINLGVFSAFFWLFYRFTRVLEARLAAWAQKTRNKWDDLFIPLLGKSLRVIVPVMGVILALPILRLPPAYEEVLSKATSALVIMAAAYLFAQAVGLGEKSVLARYDIKAEDNLRARKVHTQLRVITRTLYVLIILFAAASILMLFDEVRRFGASILASAGVVGIIFGFAAQKTIANLFAGFQLALTQPIRLDDVVIAEGEWGRIEEITLTYVVVRIWDERRLVLPLSYFIEKPFQNWTRVSAELMGSVFVWADYSLPLDETRKALKGIIEGHPFWDHRFWNLQVTDATDKSMQLRVLATSSDSSKSWDLRCDIREKLIAFIQKNHPQSLPRVRAQVGGAPQDPVSFPSA